MQKLKMITKDDVILSGEYVNVANSQAGVIFIPQMSATKESWTPYALSIDIAGVSSISLDLRGHGDSRYTTDGKFITYEMFTEEYNQNYLIDVETAADFIIQKGAPESNLFIVGASIGANLALNYSSAHPALGAVLLSPGLNYRGVESLKYASNIPPKSNVFILVSKEDKYAYNSSNDIFAGLKCNKKMEVFEGSGHGTDILKNNPVAVDMIRDWIKGILKNI